MERTKLQKVLNSLPEGMNIQELFLGQLTKSCYILSLSTAFLTLPPPLSLSISLSLSSSLYLSPLLSISPSNFLPVFPRLPLSPISTKTSKLPGFSSTSGELSPWFYGFTLGDCLPLIAGNREAELKPTTFSSLLLFHVFLSFLFS